MIQQFNLAGFGSTDARDRYADLHAAVGTHNPVYVELLLADLATISGLAGLIFKAFLTGGQAIWNSRQPIPRADGMDQLYLEQLVIQFAILFFAIVGWLLNLIGFIGKAITLVYYRIQVVVDAYNYVAGAYTGISTGRIFLP